MGLYLVATPVAGHEHDYPVRPLLQHSRRLTEPKVIAVKVTSIATTLSMFNADILDCSND